MEGNFVDTMFEFLFCMAIMAAFVAVASLPVCVAVRLWKKWQERTRWL